MSEETTEETGEVKNKITISSDDCDNVKKYCDHFGVPSSPELDAALAAFKANNTFENQMEIKLEICKWMLSCDHASFKDNLWNAPKKAAEGVVYDLQFDKDLQETLSAVEAETEE